MAVATSNQLPIDSRPRHGRWRSFQLLALAVLSFAFVAAGAGTTGAIAAGGGTACVNPGGTGGCSSTIQSAIFLAGPGGTVNVAAGTYDESRIIIPFSITITGAGATSTIVDAQQKGRVFLIATESGSAASVTINDLTIENGNTSGGFCGLPIAPQVKQACVVTQQQLSALDTAGLVQDLMDTANLTSSNLPGQVTPALSSTAFGGGILQFGPGALDLNDVILFKNTATASGESAIAAGGGIAMLNGGSLSLTNVTLDGNAAAILSAGLGISLGGGIALFGSTATLNSTLLQNNVAFSIEADLGISAGGGIAEAANLGSLGAPTVSPNAPTRTPSSLSLTNVNLNNNETGGLALFGLSLGGGIASLGGSSASILNATLTSNQILNQTIGSAISFGAGIFQGRGGPSSLTNVTVNSNTVTDMTATPSVALAGLGIHLPAALKLPANVQMPTDSISVGSNGLPGIFGPVDPNAPTPVAVSAGGGVAAVRGGSITLTNATVDANGATIGGNLAQASGATLALDGSIVAAPSMDSNCSGVITSSGYNVSDDGSCNLTATGDLQNTNPELGPLQDNGGPTLGAPGDTSPTLTQALLTGSPAIDHIAAGVCPPPATDERGVTRPQGPSCDSGAFEVVKTTTKTQPLYAPPPPVETAPAKSCTVTSPAIGTATVCTLTLTAALGPSSALVDTITSPGGAGISACSATQGLQCQPQAPNESSVQVVCSGPSPCPTGATITLTIFSNTAGALHESVAITPEGFQAQTFDVSPIPSVSFESTQSNPPTQACNGVLIPIYALCPLPNQTPSGPTQLPALLPFPAGLS